MSYPTFLLIALSATIALAVALAGPLSVLCIVGFWIAHHFFVKWNLEDAPLETMSDAQLQNVLSDWTKHGFNRFALPHQTIVRRSGDDTEITKSVHRVIGIYDELIVRYEKKGIDVSDYKRSRDLLKEELSRMVR